MVGLWITRLSCHTGCSCASVKRRFLISFDFDGGKMGVRTVGYTISALQPLDHFGKRDGRLIATLAHEENIPQILHNILVSKQFGNKRLALLAGKCRYLFGQFL